MNVLEMVKSLGGKWSYCGLCRDRVVTFPCCGNSTCNGSSCNVCHETSCAVNAMPENEKPPLRSMPFWHTRLQTWLFLNESEWNYIS